MTSTPASTTDLPPLSDEIASLLAAERAVPPPSDAVLSAVWSQVHLEITRVGAVARLAKRLGPEIVTLVALLLGVGAVLALARPRSNRDPRAVLSLDESPEGPAPASNPSTRVRPVPLRPNGVGGDPEPTPAPHSPVLLPAQTYPLLPPPPRRHAPVADRDAGMLAADAEVLRVRVDTRLEEDMLLGIARSALARRQPVAAFDAIRMHLARFPDGQFAEEREALAIRALAMAGRADEARARAAQFREAFPESMLPVEDALSTPAIPR